MAVLSNNAQTTTTVVTLNNAPENRTNGPYRTVRQLIIALTG